MVARDVGDYGVRGERAGALVCAYRRRPRLSTVRGNSYGCEVWREACVGPRKRARACVCEFASAICERICTRSSARARAITCSRAIALLPWLFSARVFARMRAGREMARASVRLCVRECVRERACVRAGVCVRAACERACVTLRACVLARVHVCVCACVRACVPRACFAVRVFVSLLERGQSASYRPRSTSLFTSPRPSATLDLH